MKRVHPNRIELDQGGPHAPPLRWARKLWSRSVTAIIAVTMALGASAQAQSKSDALDVGILTGSETAGEFDEAVGQLGWKAKKYADSDQGWQELKRNFKKHDLLLGTPGFGKVLLPSDDASVAKARAEELRSFMEKGGGIVLTGAVMPQQLEWLSLLNEDFEVTSEAPARVQANSRMERKHSYVSMPGLLSHADKFQKGYKLKKPSEWEDVARWEGMPCIIIKRFGKGFIALSSLRHPNADLLQNTEKLLRLQRFGVAYNNIFFDFEDPQNREKHREVVQGRGRVEMTVRNTSDQPQPVTGVLRIDNGKEQREVRRTINAIDSNKGGRIQLDMVADLRGKAKVQVALVNPNNGEEVAVHESETELPKFMTVVPPAYRGMISTARRDKNVHFKMRFAPIFEAIEGMPLELKVVGPDKKVVSEREMVVLSAEFPVVMDLPADAAEGEYNIVATVVRKDGQKDVDEAGFKIVPVRKGQVFVDQDAVLLKDGKPFFPIGIYHVTADQIDEVIDFGFNILQLWDRYVTPETLAKLEEKGVDVLWEGHAWGQAVHSNPLTVQDSPGFQKQLANMREAAQLYKSHPALGMWYVADEPAPYFLPALRLINQTWHEADEDHPTYLVATGDYHLLQEACDVLAIDVYLVYRGQRLPLSIVGDATDAALKGVDYRKPVIAIPQAFGYNERHHERPEDVRAMTYLHLTHGVRGVIWYCWKETGDNTRTEGAGYHPATQAVLKEMVAEIKTVAPALMEPGARQLKSDNGKVHAIICGSDATGRYLLFVNAEEVPTEGVLRVPELAGKKLSGLHGTPAATVRKGVITLKASPLATGIFKIE